MHKGEKSVVRFGGMLLKGSRQASWEVDDRLNPGGRIACVKLAELVQLTLVADGAIVDLRHYAERQRALGVPERLTTAGILLAGGEAEPSEALLWQLADPIEASASGFRSYACVPLHDLDGAPLGRVVALQRGQRAFDGHDLKILRTVADIVADLTRRPQPAS
jgi:GAF domain-containing protein